MSTSAIQKITDSKPFKAYGIFCLVRGIIVVTATTCYIVAGVANETRRAKQYPPNIHHEPNQTPYKAEPHKTDPYQCPYQTHFRNTDATNPTKLY